jgi:ferredoxin
MFDWLLGSKKPRILSMQAQNNLSPARIQVSCKGDYHWQHEHSVLDVLDKAGLAVRSSCRSGNCGACIAYLQAGQVGYTKDSNFPLEAGEILMCSCVPMGDVQIGLLSQPVSPRRRRN